MHRSQPGNRLFAVALSMAGVHGAVAVAMGAYAAHGMDDGFDAEAVTLVQTAGIFQLVHAAVLVGAAAALRSARRRSGRALAVAVVAHGLGALLFCGALYGAAFTDLGSFGLVAPIGGSLLIGGWVALAAAGILALGRDDGG